jgi:CspA family cold shock protein
MPTRRKVIWFSKSAGYGFIATEDGEEILEPFSEIASACRKSLCEGEDVAFDAFTDPQGSNAPHIVKLAIAPSKKAEQTVI